MHVQNLHSNNSFETHMPGAVQRVEPGGWVMGSPFWTFNSPVRRRTLYRGSLSHGGHQLGYYTGQVVQQGSNLVRLDHTSGP